MYRGSPPIFDVPEFPPLRRLKPLPKRRRTIDVALQVTNGAASVVPNMLGAEGIAEELIAHADSLSSQMALQSYYMPMLGGAHNLLSNEGENRATDAIDFGAGYQLADERTGREEDDRGEGDYVDHLQQPGNTKKRKVPANASASLQGHDIGLDHLGSEEEPFLGAGVLTSGRPDQNVTDNAVVAPLPGILPQRRGKMTASTLAGLQHKEMLKYRKRQLAAVLGALSHGDTLALDQALSSHYPFTITNIGFAADTNNPDPPRIRLSRRRGPRFSRAARIRLSDSSNGVRNVSRVASPTCQFAFVCRSATSDRLLATKEEVATLRSRFEAELARQAAKAAKAASEAKKAALTASKGTRSKRSDKGRQHSRNDNLQVGDQTPDSLETSLSGLSGRGSKKKKRSALAIASNPHHRKNYVPSRLPLTGQANAAQATLNAQNSLGPFPLRFLSAEIPPRRRKKSTAMTPTSQIVNPADEWICPFCEYKLFYGDGPEYRRSIRTRKQILRRRRRAQERAAGGLSAPKPTERATLEQEEYDAGFAPSPTDFSSSLSNKAGVKEGPDIGKAKGPVHPQSSFG
ncbi:hypothetical protein SERLA73DRAFT_187432 [Serpula lacrymans var. lacrymans S7.3]|uniref:Uncharacterized protein n=2 Tax=Serpula lacrymans var. lacrymans TaxID=341189 RepID=F8Q962_SERL3|nr:uncharacterized protein SERLADRAFT_476970 [Serpula lacrymans var. lacrymans S7.9]EGN95117.1 hypothetical protein SERLA73DRAFT_187432 [Serpula lacrymans var. lacrymans S7.3]EGO20604.1 hypothetical protein SERLADRAFT_476970 [Serpula lacrymans var. lacrymans S7.9]